MLKRPKVGVFLLRALSREKKIREHPAADASSIVKKVFGALAK